MSSDVRVVMEADRDARVELIGSNVDYYLRKFEKLDTEGGWTWNWCGFFFSFVWLAYRKNYGWAAAAVLVPNAVVFVMGIFAYITRLQLFVFIAGVLSIAISIFFGLAANSIYRSKIDRLAETMPSDETERRRYADRMGGTSAIALVAALAINVIVNTLANGEFLYVHFLF